MLGFAPRLEFPVRHAKVDEGSKVALLGRGVKERGGDVVAVGPLGVAPDLRAVGALGDNVRLSPLAVDFGRGLTSLERFEHMMGAYLSASLINRSAAANHDGS